MGLLGQLNQENRTNFLDKAELWKHNHQLTITSVERITGKFGEQWKIGARVETEMSPEGVITEGFIAFPTATKSRNNVLEGLSEHIATNGPYKGASLQGKIMTEATPLKEAVVYYWLDEWALDESPAM